MLVRQMTNDDLCTFANQVKDLIYDRFQVEGLDKCAIVIVEKGVFGKVWEKFFGGNSTEAHIRLMTDVQAKHTEDI